ncbi:MAG: hypothetical protein AB1746_13085, partial [Candidatus Zixiibacteriota bacterium]
MSFRNWIKDIGKKCIEHWIIKGSFLLLCTFVVILLSNPKNIALLIWNHLKSPIFSVTIYTGYIYVFVIIALYFSYKILSIKTKKEIDKQIECTGAEITTPLSEIDDKQRIDNRTEYSGVEIPIPLPDKYDRQRTLEYFLSSYKVTHKYDEAITKLRKSFVELGIRWEWDTSVKIDGSIYISKIRMFCPDCDMEV